MKIVINDCYGGFGLSKEAYEFMGIDYEQFGTFYHSVNGDPARNDPKLVECVETLGHRASGRFACLKVIEIPDDVKWKIEDYDGLESVVEEHRVWRF